MWLLRWKARSKMNTAINALAVECCMAATVLDCFIVRCHSLTADAKDASYFWGTIEWRMWISSFAKFCFLFVRSLYEEKQKEAASNAPKIQLDGYYSDYAAKTPLQSLNLSILLWESWAWCFCQSYWLISASDEGDCDNWFYKLAGFYHISPINRVVHISITECDSRCGAGSGGYRYPLREVMRLCSHAYRHLQDCRPAPFRLSYTY